MQHFWSSVRCLSYETTLSSLAFLKEWEPATYFALQCTAGFVLSLPSKKKHMDGELVAALWSCEDTSIPARRKQKKTNSPQTVVPIFVTSNISHNSSSSRWLKKKEGQKLR